MAFILTRRVLTSLKFIAINVDRRLDFKWRVRILVVPEILDTLCIIRRWSIQCRYQSGTIWSPDIAVVHSAGVCSTLES